MKFTSVSSEIREACEHKVRETVALCQPHTPKAITVPALKFRQMGRRAGVCYFRQNLIVINPDFFANHFEDMIQNTVPHEVAHHVSFSLFGRAGTGHGHHWKNIMKNWLGLPAPRHCHSYSLEGVKVRTVARPFKYLCSCQAHWLTQGMHRKIQLARQHRICRKCKSRLKYEAHTGNHLN